MLFRNMALPEQQSDQTQPAAGSQNQEHTAEPTTSPTEAIVDSRLAQVFSTLNAYYQPVDPTQKPKPQPYRTSVSQRDLELISKPHRLLS